MTDYTELVKALRHCVSDEKGVTKCAGCPYYPDITGCMDRIHTDAAAAIEELQARLGEAENSVERWKDMYLTKHEPKLGEWIYHPKDAIEMMFTLPKCSICGHESSDALNYCPNCGAKMNDSNASNALNALDNAQDGPIITPCRGCSDYDGYGGCKSKGGCARARMEVQK